MLRSWFWQTIDTIHVRPHDVFLCVRVVLENGVKAQPFHYLFPVVQYDSFDLGRIKSFQKAF